MVGPREHVVRAVRPPNKNARSQRAAVLTRRITLQAQAQRDADELRIHSKISREPELDTDELKPNDRPSRRAPIRGSATAVPIGD